MKMTADRNMFTANIALGARIVLFILAVSFGVATLIAASQAALAASLKDVSVISGEKLRLGDLFDGLKENADYILGPAPQPGQEMVLNARTLYRIANAMNVSWQPVSNADQVVVRRAATIIPREDIESALREKVTDSGVDGKFTLNLSGENPQMVLPPEETAAFEIVSFRFDPQSDMFEASLAAPSDENAAKRMSVAGRIERITPVPVLKASLQNGDVIGQADIDWIDLPARKIQHDIVIKEEDIIGMTPRRIAYAGKPLMTTELERPRIVKRGEEVTIMFRDGPLVLSAKGKAMQTGAAGDIVRVVNTASNRSLEGVVTGEREVTVQ